MDKPNDVNDYSISTLQILKPALDFCGFGIVTLIVPTKNAFIHEPFRKILKEAFPTATLQRFEKDKDENFCFTYIGGINNTIKDNLYHLNDFMKIEAVRDVMFDYDVQISSFSTTHFSTRTICRRDD